MHTLNSDVARICAERLICCFRNRSAANESAQLDATVVRNTHAAKSGSVAENSDQTKARDGSDRQSCKNPFEDFGKKRSRKPDYFNIGTSPVTKKWSLRHGHRSEESMKSSPAGAAPVSAIFARSLVTMAQN